MKIGLNTPSYIGNDTKALTDARQQPAGQAGADTAKKAEAPKGDVVQLSGRSRLIARATELATNAPEVREEKVADIKSRLAAGTYNVSGRVVAESLLRHSITEV